MQVDKSLFAPSRQTKTPLKVLGDHGPVDAVTWTPDSRQVVFSDMVDGVKVWTPQGDQPPRLLDSYKPGTHKSGMALSPDGRWVAGGDVDNVVTLYDVETGEPRFCFREGPARKDDGSPNFVQRLAFSPDGRHLLTAADTDEVKLWSFDPEQGVSLVRTVELESACSGIAFSPDGEQLVLGTVSDLRILDLARDEPLKIFPDFGGIGVQVSDLGVVAVNTSRWNEDLGFTREVVAIDLASLEVVARRDLAGYRMAFEPGTNELYVGAERKNEMTRWSIDRQVVQEYQLDESSSGGVGGLNFSPDGSRLAVSCSFDSLKILAARDAAEALSSPDLAIEVGDDWLLVGDFMLERNHD